MKRAALLVLRWSAAFVLAVVACPLMVIVVLLSCAVVGFVWVAADLTRPEWAKNMEVPRGRSAAVTPPAMAKIQERTRAN